MKSGAVNIIMFVYIFEYGGVRKAMETLACYSSVKALGKSSGLSDVRKISACCGGASESDKTTACCGEV